MKVYAGRASGIARKACFPDERLGVGNRRVPALRLTRDCVAMRLTRA